MQIPTAPTVCPAAFIEYNDIHHRWVRPQPLMISGPWSPSFPLAHAFTRARIFCEGSGHQTRAGLVLSTYYRVKSIASLLYVPHHTVEY